MNKENRKMAQERRAKERKKEAQKKMARNIIIVVLVVAVFGGIIGYGIYDSNQVDVAEDTTDSTETTDTTESTDTTETTDETESTEETESEVAYNTDTSLVVEDGDTVDINYVGSIDGFEFEGGTSDNYALTIGSGTFIDDFEEQLIGANVGDTVEVVVNFPDDDGRTYTDANGEEQSFNGAEALFVVTINGIYE